ncbi:MAG: archaetidylserine decarboxylase [Pontixanthobacter sp.]
MSVSSPRPFILSQHVAPQHRLSRFAGRFANSERPWLRDRLIRRFIEAYDVNMDEAAQPEGTFRSFNDFFTRALKPGARALADTSTDVICPADGEISQIGHIHRGRIVQAKGQSYTVRELVGGEEALAKRFDGGNFATVYLSPSDYHRVHMPCTGTLTETVHIPGDLFSVNTTTADHVDRLFARNERMSCVFDTPHGAMASVMVGAMIVASIETVWGGLAKAHGKHPVAVDYSHDIQAPRLDAGAEMGRFLLGSTVILLFEPSKVEWDESLEPGTIVRMGQSMGRWL